MDSQHDGQLLSDVASDGSEAAFEELVRRHGSMVLNQSRRLLSDTHEAEDATQAVFLVLWKKAGSLRNSSTVAAWLHRVTRNVCCNAQRSRNARKLKERRAMEMKQPPPSDHQQWDEINNILDDELNRLPEKYRLPLILFHLEGRQLDEIAELTSTNSSTVGTRLRRGREMLRNRIVRRGITIGTASLLAAIGIHAGAADVSASFVATTVQSANLFGAGHVVPTGVLSAQSINLAKGTLQMLAVTKFKIAIVTIAAAVAFGGVSSAVISTVLHADTPQADVNSVVEHDPTSKWNSLKEDEADRLAARHVGAITLAIHSYIDAHDGELPPPVILNADLPPEKRLSGLVLLLPYFKIPPSYLKKDDKFWLEKRIDPVEADAAEKLYQSIDQTKAWDDPVNLSAGKSIVPAFLAPGGGAHRDQRGFAISHFAFVRGYAGEDNGAFPEKGHIFLADPEGKKDVITDGTTGTLSIGQINDHFGPWIASGQSTWRFFNDEKTPNFGSHHGRAAYFSKCDGSVFFLDLQATRETALEALVTRAGDDQNRLMRIKAFHSVEDWKKSNKTGRK